MNKDVETALMAIGSSYHKIIIVDLKKDSNQIVRIRDEELEKQWGHSEKTSEWIKSFAENGKVHPEDREHFLRIVDFENLREHFDSGENAVVFRYRRMCGREFRWSVMDILKAEEYTEENPVVCFCVKDIHEVFSDEIEERDYVTGGMNRKGFLRYGREILDSATETESLAVLNFNVKGFKAINEMFGTSGGDEVLKELYRHLKQSFLQPMLLARVEGDSFACIVNRDQLDYALLNSICFIIYSKNDKRVKIDIRCGIYLVEDQSVSIHRMYDYAKLAVRNVSDRLSQAYVVFDESMRQEYLTKVEIQSRLEEGLENKEFEVYYQPVYMIQKDEMTGAEAYVRWNYPNKGVLEPHLFLSYIEEAGIITKLDYFVVCQVRDMMLERQAAGKSVLPISVNLSWMDLYDKKMMDTIVDIVENKQLPLLFELSEQAYQTLLERGDEGLNKFRHMRRRLFLDSFGSGNSSFNMLRNYQIESVKLDSQFIQRLDTDSRVKSMVHSVIDLFSHFNSIVTAVGVETQGQLDFLKRQGCHFAQGNFLMKPLPRNEFEEYIDSYTSNGEVEDVRGVIDISEFFDVEELQIVQDCFSDMTGMAALFTNVQGVPVTETRHPSTFCQYVRSTEEGVEACKQCDAHGAKMAKDQGKPCFYKCHAGLYDCAAPIMANNEYVGSFIGGQVLIGEPDLEEFRQLAVEKGLDPERYLELLKQIPIITKEKMDVALNYISVNTNVLSDLAYNKYRLDYSNDLLQDKNLELDFLANYDKLTKLSNRHHAQDYFREYENSGRDFCVVLSDIDDFKKVNDTYGHDCGDAVLASLAEIMREVLGTKGVPCRWGGEEFLCLVYGERENALKILEELRKEIEAHKLEYQGNVVQVTMTFGMTYCEEQPSIEKMISMADKRLYSGKRNGKNQIVWNEATTFSMNTMMDSMMNFGPMNA